MSSDFLKDSKALFTNNPFLDGTDDEETIIPTRTEFELPEIDLTKTYLNPNENINNTEEKALSSLTYPDENIENHNLHNFNTAQEEGYPTSATQKIQPQEETYYETHIQENIDTYDDYDEDYYDEQYEEIDDYDETDSLDINKIIAKHQNSLIETDEQEAENEIDEPETFGYDSKESIINSIINYQDDELGTDNEIDEILDGNQAYLYGEKETYEEDEYALLNIDEVLAKAIDLGASDVHIDANKTIAYRILGDITRDNEHDEIDPNVLQKIYTQITTHQSQALFAENLELDTSYVLKTTHHKGRRTRLNAYRSFNHMGLVFRIINDNIPTPQQLGLSETMLGWLNYNDGLFILGGATGSGKTTSFASIVRKIQLEQPKKIVTIEKPVEYIYPDDGLAFITQREVGGDTRSFSAALTSAMRQDPDIILVGEIRNREEVDEFLRASETGHLAFSTMHTKTPPETISRIMSLYEGQDLGRILSTLESSTRGLANQALLKTKDGKSRFAVQTVLEINSKVREMIATGNVREMQQYMKDNKISTEHMLLKAYYDGKCTKQEAQKHASDPIYFKELLSQKTIL